jgi:hypothetical protein
MAPPATPTWPSAPTARLFAAALGFGMAVGGGMGMFAAVALFGAGALFAAGPAAIAGGFVGLNAAVVLGAVVVAIADVRHRPLRDPASFQRDLWVVFTLTSLPVLALLTALFGESDTRAAVGVPAGIVALLLMLRSAGRQLVILYARAYGWTVRSPFDELPAKPGV